MTEWVPTKTTSLDVPTFDSARFRNKLRDWGLSALPIVAILVVWQLVAASGTVAEYLLPAPLDVLDRLWTDLSNGRIAELLMASMSHYLMGLAWGIGLGVVLGLVVGWFSLAERMLEPLIALLRPIPPLAWIPFAILVIGINTQAAAFIIGIGAFYINFYNTLSGVRSVDKKLLEAARVLGDSSPGLIWRVVIPAAAPAILTGIRISLGQGWMTVIAAEMFGIQGLGQRLFEAAGLLAMDIVLAYMVVIGSMHMLMDGGFRLVENYVLRWR